MDPKMARAMADIICRCNIDAIADNPDLRTITRLLIKRGYTVTAIQNNLSDAVLMARIRQSNEQRLKEKTQGPKPL